MKVENIKINNIPAILWGEKSTKLFIGVHGNMSSKSDIPISVLAEVATQLGYQVLSFDLPQHGNRKNEPTLCKVQNCVSELKTIMGFAKSQSQSISLMANSMGAYFSLLAYRKEPLKQSLFLSPVVNMERIIYNMMNWFNISEEQLHKEYEILTPTGQTIYWDYYQYVKSHPINEWNIPTSILYGKNDTLCEYDFVSSFAKMFGCKFEVSDTSEHYFHTEKDINIYRNWLMTNIIN
ncbi:alpha/beta hydrolase [Anaerovorax odorimutans]|uniref:alpha/beta hydrolase n=1 Tax=Anaerovorax odorimutans TaxID=109327 RepID=UPI0004209770|nr:alpha/beta hydrolase [Anaerovorax odorimutans]